MIKLKTCEVMQYLKFIPDFTVDNFIERIKNLTNLKTFSFIIHDKDVNEDGSLKPPHFHAVLTFSETTTSSVVANMLGVEEQYVNKIKYTTKSAELYLIHRNNPEKYQYPISDVISNFDYISKYSDTKPLPNLDEIADKIDSGIIKPYNIDKYLGISTYAKHKPYIDRCFEYRQNKLKGIDRDMKGIFITGASGVGKTSFAKMYATDSGYECYISSGGKHPLDDYKGQECIILDDLRDSDYRLSDFLKLTDNNTNSLVGCRFYNKSISECKLLIVTSIKSIDEFYNNIAKIDDEPLIQLYRRFPTYIKMTQEDVSFYTFNLSSRKYEFDASCVNPISIMYNRDIRKQVTDDIIKTLKLKRREDFSPVPDEHTDFPFN